MIHTFFGASKSCACIKNHVAPGRLQATNFPLVTVSRPLIKKNEILIPSTGTKPVSINNEVSIF